MHSSNKVIGYCIIYRYICVHVPYTHIYKERTNPAKNKMTCGYKEINYVGKDLEFIKKVNIILK